MSKRYGRNQRRAAREEIARLNESLRLCHASATMYLADSMNQRAIIDQMEQRLHDAQGEIERLRGQGQA